MVVGLGRQLEIDSAQGILVRQFGHPHFDRFAKSGKHTFIIRQVRIRWSPGNRIGARIGIAEQERFISDLARQIGNVVRERRSVAYRTVVHGIAPREQACSRGAAWRRDGKMVGESNALRHQKPQVWKPDRPGRLARHAIGAKPARHNEHDFAGHDGDLSVSAPMTSADGFERSQARNQTSVQPRLFRWFDNRSRLPVRIGDNGAIRRFKRFVQKMRLAVSNISYY